MNASVAYKKGNSHGQAENPSSVSQTHEEGQGWRQEKDWQVTGISSPQEKVRLALGLTQPVRQTVQAGDQDNASTDRITKRADDRPVNSRQESAFGDAGGSGGTDSQGESTPRPVCLDSGIQRGGTADAASSGGSEEDRQVTKQELSPSEAIGGEATHAGASPSSYIDRHEVMYQKDREDYLADRLNNVIDFAKVAIEAGLPLEPEPYQQRVINDLKGEDHAISQQETTEVHVCKSPQDREEVGQGSQGQGETDRAEEKTQKALIIDDPRIPTKKRQRKIARYQIPDWFAASMRRARIQDCTQLQFIEQNAKAMDDAERLFEERRAKWRSYLRPLLY